MNNDSGPNKWHGIKSLETLDCKVFFPLHHTSIQGDEKHTFSHCIRELTPRQITQQFLSGLKAKAFLMSEQI